MTTLNQDLLFRTPHVYSWGNGFDVSPAGRSIVYMWNGSEQLMAGGNDVRCPLAEAEQVRDKLFELGRPVELQVYADEGHILRQLNNRVDAYQQRAAFIDHYLTA